MVDATSRDWVAWGENDPYLAVMGYLPDGRPWQEDDFYASGAIEWEAIERRWQRFGLARDRQILDLGCGAGRLTAQMARTFPKVVGVDVSREQIELARRAVADAPAEAAFHLSDGSKIPLTDEAVDHVFSANVFQHLEQQVTETLIDEVSRVLAPGGTAMLHIPVPGSNLTTTCGRIVVKRTLDPLLTVAHRLRHRTLGGHPPMRARVYDAVAVFALMERAGLADLEMILFRTTPDHMYMSTFFARKPT